MGVYAILEDGHLALADEAQIEDEITGIPAGEGSNIPVVALAAGDGDIFPDLTADRDGLVPSGGESGDEVGALGLCHVVGRGVAKHGQRGLEDSVLGELAAAGALAHR